jgi:hypothetical protein
MPTWLHDKCPKVAKIHKCFKHLLTYFVRYSLGFPHFIVYICFKLFLSSFSKSHPFVQEMKIWRKKLKLTRQGELRASARRSKSESSTFHNPTTRHGEQEANSLVTACTERVQGKSSQRASVWKMAHTPQRVEARQSEQCTRHSEWKRLKIH